MKASKAFQKTTIALGAIAIMLTISSCAHVTPIEECVQDEPYGFWFGLWHGVIAPFSFVISLFNDEVAMYGINNNGGWYDFGFVLGAGILFGSGGRNAKKRS